jgi:hypothetical protein
MGNHRVVVPGRLALRAGDHFANWLLPLGPAHHHVRPGGYRTLSRPAALSTWIGLDLAAAVPAQHAMLLRFRVPSS